MESKGEEDVSEFINDRLVLKKVSICEPIRKNYAQRQQLAAKSQEQNFDSCPLTETHTHTRKHAQSDLTNSL